MVRTLCFTAYGAIVGGAYITLLAVAFPPGSVGDWVGIGFWGIVFLFFFGLFGWGLATTPDSAHWRKWSNLKILVCLPLMPLGTVCGGMVFWGIVFPLYVVLGLPFFYVKSMLDERRLRKQLASKARFITLDALRPRLEAGEGVLIQELGIKGTSHIWWTQETSLAAVVPPSSEEDLEMFHAQMRKEYLDPHSGRAVLTSIPPRYARKLGHKFPKMPIAYLAGVDYLGVPISSRPDEKYNGQTAP
jgi:hypothetical protein